MDYTDYLKFIAALILVLSMMGGLAFILKKLGLDRGGNLMSGKRRLKLVEILSLDTKNKVALIQCDDKQHLVLLNINGTSIIDNNITPPASTTTTTTTRADEKT